MENNIRTMDFIGIDDWGRPVYKCVETGNLYKDVTLGSTTPDLCSCGNDFDGEPNCSIRKDLEIRFNEKLEQPTQEQKFNYQLLDRLRSDCDYYLGYGNKNVNNLWAGNVEDHIAKMKELYNSFEDKDKPEWITMERILEYEKAMIR